MSAFLLAMSLSVIAGSSYFVLRAKLVALVRSIHPDIYAKIQMGTAPSFMMFGPIIIDNLEAKLEAAGLDLEAPSPIRRHLWWMRFCFVSTFLLGVGSVFALI